MEKSTRDAAWVGTWALVCMAADTRALCKAFKAVDITATQRCRHDGQLILHTAFHLHGAAGCTHAPLLTRHAYVEGTYEEYDLMQGFCKEGLAHFRFHPANLPERSTWHPPTIARFESNSEHLQNAQRCYSLIESNEQLV